jgi:uroporphyrinogen-III synthase
LPVTVAVRAQPQGAPDAIDLRFEASVPGLHGQRQRLVDDPQAAPQLLLGHAERRVEPQDVAAHRRDQAVLQQIALEAVEDARRRDVARRQRRNERLARPLRALGHDVVEVPLIALERLSDEPIDVTPYDWIVVTSVNGAKELARRRVGEPKQLAAIGPGTAEALRVHGLQPNLIPAVSTQEGLAAALPRPAGRVLLAAAEGARTHLVDELGAELVPLYRTRELRPELPPADVVVLASASAARAFARLGSPLPAVSIGPETTRAARDAGVEVVREAQPHTLDGLVAAVAETAIRLPPACSSPS